MGWVLHGGTTTTHAVRVALRGRRQALDRTAATLQAKPNPSHSGTKHLGAGITRSTNAALPRAGSHCHSPTKEEKVNRAGFVGVSEPCEGGAWNVVGEGDLCPWLPPVIARVRSSFSPRGLAVQWDGSWLDLRGATGVGSVRFSNAAVSDQIRAECAHEMRRNRKLDALPDPSPGSACWSGAASFLPLLMPGTAWQLDIEPAAVRLG